MVAQLLIMGLGAMGRRMAQRLLEAKYPVIVWNRSAAPAEELCSRGATRAHLPREAAEQAQVVISMVTDDEASRSVWADPATGALGGLRAGSIALECSTLTPAWAAELAALVQGRGAAFLDAPVVGSRPQAEAGQLIYLVGGEQEALARVKEVLGAMGGAIHHLGPVGAGARMKLAVNALFGIQVAVLGELLGGLRRSGVEVARAFEVLGSLPVCSPALKGAGGLMVARRFEPLFPIHLVEKDFRYALRAAQEVGAQLPLVAQAHEVFSRARQQGHGEENITAVARLFD